MRAAPELERVPALYLMSTMDNAVKLGKFPENYVGMYWSNSAKKGQEGFLPYVVLKGKQNVEVGGLAYFKNDAVDAALQKGLSTADPAERKVAYDEVQKVVWQQAPWIFLSINTLVAGRDKRLTGLTQQPDTALTYEEADLK